MSDSVTRLTPKPRPATVNTRGRLWAARLINNPRRTKIGHVEDFPVLHMRSLRKSATSGRLRLFFLGGNLPGRAELARLSSYHFCRSFKGSFGLPPHRYHALR